MISIPAIRGSLDSKYETIERKPIFSFNGEQIAEVSNVPPLLVSANKTGSAYKTRTEGFENLHNLKIEEVIDLMRDAGKIFLGDSLSMTFKEYVKAVVSIKGLPIRTVENAAKMISAVLEDMGNILIMHTSDVREKTGLKDAYDENIIKKNLFQYAWIPQGRNLGVVMPANHPAVNIIWLEALAVKYPIVIRPSFEGIFTPYRLIESFYEAGFPDHSLYFLPGGHELVDRMVELLDKKIIFGGENIKRKYEHRNDIKVYGPGRSKMIVDSDCSIEEAKKLIVESMMVDGGRGCINLSAVVAKEKAEELARAVAEEVSKIKHRDPSHPDAMLAAMREDTAKNINQHIEKHIQNGAKDITSEYRGERYIEENDTHFILPTVVYCEKPDHPLFGQEFPFPFITVTRADDLHKHSKNSLVVTVLTENEKMTRDILMDPSIKKLYKRLSTFDINPLEPHEGYLTDFLYEKNAVSF